MDSFLQGVMKVIVGKGIIVVRFLCTHVDSPALTNRHLSHQVPERTLQKSHKQWLSDKDLRHTHNFMPERSAPIDVPSAKTSLGCQRRPCGSTVMAPATGPTPEIEMKIPFPQFLNINSHPAHPHSNMDYRSLPEKPPTPALVNPFSYIPQKELQAEKDAEDREALKAKAIQQWKIERSKEFLPPPFAPPADYSYGPEDFELADDFDRIIFLPLEEELLTWYWSDDITSRLASDRNAMPTRHDLEPLFSHPQLIRVKAEWDLAAWKLSKQKQVRWTRDSEKPRCPESLNSQEPNNPESCESGAQPSVPMKRLQSHHESEDENSPFAAAGASSTLHRAEALTKESHEFSEKDFYSSEESYQGSAWTDENSDYYNDPTPGLFMATEEPSWFREEGESEMRC